MISTQFPQYRHWLRQFCQT